MTTFTAMVMFPGSDNVPKDENVPAMTTFTMQILLMIILALALIPVIWK